MFFHWFSSVFSYGFGCLLGSDCSLWQGAGGTEFARFGSRTCFLRWFYRRSQAYFGQNSEEHVKTIKNAIWRSKTMIFDKKHAFSLSDTFFAKIVVFDLQTTFFHCFTVFFRCLAEIHLRTPIKSPQKASSRTQSLNFHPTCTLP